MSVRLELDLAKKAGRVYTNYFARSFRKRTALAEPTLERGVFYLAPRLIAQISFQEWTADRKLRQPVFLGLRDDKHPQRGYSAGDSEMKNPKIARKAQKELPAVIPSG